MTMRKKMVALLAVSLAGFLALAETETRKLDSYDFSIVRSDIKTGKSVFYDISYTPHKSISPIHVYMLANSEVSFTEDNLAAMFEYLSHDSFLYYASDVLAPLGLSESKYEVVSQKSGGKSNFVFIREK